MPPTLTNYAEFNTTVGVGRATDPYTASVASVSWQTGDVLVCVAVNEGLNSGDTFATPTNTGTGLNVWTPQRTHAVSSDCGIGLWTTTATGNGSGVVSTVCTVGSNGTHLAMGVYVFHAASGTIAVGNTNIGTGLTDATLGHSNTVSITMTSAHSAVVWAGGDWGANAPATYYTTTPATTSHDASSPGPSASPIADTIAGAYTWMIDEMDDQASTGSQAYGYTNASAPTSPKWSIVVCEIVMVAPPTTQTVLPDSDITTTGWTPSTGTTIYGVLADSDDATYASSTLS